MNKIALYIALACAMLAPRIVAAQQTGVLVTNGNESVVFVLEDKPTVTYTVSSVVFSTAERTVEYPIESTVTVTFTDCSGAVETEVTTPRFDVGFGEVRASGLTPDETVSIYTCTGKLVLSGRADADGTLSVPADQLPAEPMIIKTYKYAFKFIIRK